MLHRNHHIGHGKTSLLKRRHFTALALLAGSLGSSGLVLAQYTARATAAPSAGKPGAPIILVVGDSLSAEYGLKRGTGWVALLELQLQEGKHPHQVVNASISGDTTSGGRSRLPALLKQHQPAIVIIELGGNDALRGLPLNMTRDNLATMARQSRAAGAKVLLLGMEMPPNYGARYGQEFRELYTTVAQEQKTALLPFFLKGVGDLADPTRLFQSDRIHPNERAQPIMLGNVWPELKKLL
ncbi:arylesterase [Hydrogenophaga sp.]|uniref:arylesterase n=1 Tax=Hydrogenophaga sp. TaxID=1904254 RepID=UPI0025B8BD3E|nr:arylesterase [Hydrogenophaga sp.]